ncbi:MAG: cobalamin-dependent protein [Candidatus Competibacter sp.]|nr:cobalamin-dependent protein [Candidatus Competibacteraceae bacterium]HRD68368.1 cobalamin-dependent protein [Candidatus Competibacter sp.]
MLKRYIKAYNEAVFETDKEAAFTAVSAALTQGVKAEDIVFKIVIPTVEEMMSMITKDPDANLAQHFMTAQITAEVTEKMLERFEHPPEIIGRVVIGTAHGDLHSLGKRIVMGCLKALMVETIDLGVNVTAEKFVDTAIAREAQVIAVSAMMAHTATGEDGARKVRRLLKERGLERCCKLIVGGAPYRYDTELYQSVGADSWAPDGINAARAIIDLIQKVKST